MSTVGVERLWFGYGLKGCSVVWFSVVMASMV